MSNQDQKIDIEQYKIGTEPYYEAMGNEVALYEAAYKSRMPVMVKGPTGCGKSRFVGHMAYKLDRPLIAKFNNHDIYSYEYEMMQAAEIVYSNAKGLVAEFIDEGILNIEAFELAWHENNALNKLLSIAEAHMNITDFLSAY